MTSPTLNLGSAIHCFGPSARSSGVECSGPEDSVVYTNRGLKPSADHLKVHALVVPQSLLPLDGFFRLRRSSTFGGHWERLSSRSYCWETSNRYLISGQGGVAIHSSSRLQPLPYYLLRYVFSLTTFKAYCRSTTFCTYTCVPLHRISRLSHARRPLQFIRASM